MYLISSEQVDYDLRCLHADSDSTVDAAIAVDGLVFHSDVRKNRLGQESRALNRGTCSPFLHPNSQRLCTRLSLFAKGHNFQAFLQVPLLVFVRNPLTLIAAGFGIFLVFATLVFTPAAFPYSGDLENPKPQRFWIYVRPLTCVFSKQTEDRIDNKQKRSNS